MKVDATQGVARVIFDETAFLGIEYDAAIGDVITLQGGETDIKIYNAAESGPLSFLISFSSAQTLVAATAAAAFLTTL